MTARAGIRGAARPSPPPPAELRAERIAGLAMTLPALAFFVVFVGYPITQTILIGFQRWNAISAPEWIGLANYRMLDDPVFRHACSSPSSSPRR